MLCVLPSLAVVRAVINDAHANHRNQMYSLVRFTFTSGVSHTCIYFPRPMLNTDMDYLDLSANMLTGMLPAKLGELTDITYLNVSRNRLSVRDIH